MFTLYQRIKSSSYTLSQINAQPSMILKGLKKKNEKHGELVDSKNVSSNFKCSGTELSYCEVYFQKI